MYTRLLLLLCYALCAFSLELVFTTPPPDSKPTLSLPHKFRHKFHRAHEINRETNHNNNGPSKADLVMAVTDKFGTIVNNFAESLAADLDDVFHMTPPPLGQDVFTTPMPDHLP